MLQMDSKVDVYDLCVVGAGMFGSAAARHASAFAGVKVCLVGPDEPTVEEKKTREIFGAHYDEGRITRIFDENIPTHVLTKRTISRCRELEELSGIHFYYPVGCMIVGKKNGPCMEKLLQVANTSKLSFVDLSWNDVLKKRYPFLKLKPDDQPILDDDKVGHLSPRSMVAAQKKVAQLQGCHLVTDVVEEVKPQLNEFHEIKTKSGRILKAKRVLICTGAFTNFKNLGIPKLKMCICKETVAFLRIPLDEAQRLSSMTTISYIRPEDNIEVYILPPIQYPDGHYYLKIGNLDFAEDEIVKTLDEVKDWYNSKGDPKRIKQLSEILKSILPGLKYEEISGMTCVTCDNPATEPYIDRVSPTVTVAVVGNARGAKKSDEVGRIAAILSLTGKWDSELNQAHFKIMKDEEED